MSATHSTKEMPSVKDRPPLRVLGLAGSLRAGSYNRALLDAAATLAPERMSIETFDLAPLPLYNADLDTDGERPAAAQKLKDAIAEADALLVASPEYNHSVPGVLKNAIDWASRPGFDSVLKGKPIALMGASKSAVGTARAQEHLKPIFDATLSRVMPHRGVVVAAAHKKFDAEGHLIDGVTQQHVASFLESFRAFARQVGGPREHVRAEATQA